MDPELVRSPFNVKLFETFNIPSILTFKSLITALLAVVKLLVLIHTSEFKWDIMYRFAERSGDDDVCLSHLNPSHLYQFSAVPQSVLDNPPQTHESLSKSS